MPWLLLLAAMVAITNILTDQSDVIACTRNNIHSSMLWVCSHSFNECAATCNWSSVVGAQQTEQITEQSIIILQSTTVLLDVCSSWYKPCKWSGLLAQATQLTAVQYVNVTLHVLTNIRNMLQWTNSNITIMIGSLSYFMGTISCYTLHALFDF